jgi:hypothetical protein
MSDAEIKHSATAPFRMLRRLENFSGPFPLNNFSKEIIPSRANHSIRELFLVPGGRHLVLMTNKGLEMLGLETNYHLAHPWGTLVKNLVFVRGDRAWLCGVAQHSNPTKDAFRIATRNSEEENGERYI